LIGKGRLKSTYALEFALPLVISLIWVGSYGYRYNISCFNSEPVNWLALLLWTGGLFATLQVHRFMEWRVKGFWIALPLTWIVYFIVLLGVEHIGYNILEIRQLTTEGPLILGLIHGPWVMKIYYVFAGLGTILLGRVLSGKLAIPEGERDPFCHKSRGNFYEYDSDKGLKKAL
jgi:hypothetical protein